MTHPTQGWGELSEVGAAGPRRGREQMHALLLRGRGAVPKVPRPPRPSSLATTAVMKANRAINTRPERILRHALWTRGTRGYRIAPRLVPGRPDVTFGRARVAIFVHGCFWHQHGCRRAPSFPKSNVEYWTLKFQLNKTRDDHTAAVLRGAGWKVLIFWECEVLSDSGHAADRIRRAVARRASMKLPFRAAG
jgi:DNA mismatch endonuclease, patch repair protein